MCSPWVLACTATKILKLRDSETNYVRSSIFYPVRTVERNSLESFWDFGMFCLLYIHINNNKFTYDEFQTEKFEFIIFNMFS